MKFSAAAVLATMMFTLPATADMPGKSDHSHPKKISREQIAGKFFDDHRPLVKMHDSELGKYKTEDLENFLSADKKFDSGMYKSGPSKFTIEHYGVDEFMYFIEGGVTLTSADGTVTEIKAGDAVTIGKDWHGVWESDGYMKIYVIYSPDEPLE
ncbi:cupin domain-containing protein [Kordiimonas aestuarii]|uniref:cupin domain-containing protein n=1 Tax=Kordiimonas aestuarii TaxID=1005925 RepID=UPI0021CE23D0|nr:cupin domain-containing protein [Kordiimonas aestuarii]